MKNNNKPIPFEFILDQLHSKKVEVNHMFGCFGLYIDNRLCFFLRNREDKKRLNGVWLAVNSASDYQTLKKELPSIHQDEVLAKNSSKNKWLLLSSHDENFEGLVIKACEMVLSGDNRIGKVTKGSLSK